MYDITYFQLYHECNEYMANEEDNNKAKEARNTWPAFVWATLKNTDVRQIYGSKIW